MPEQFHCLIDASGSMAEQDKYGLSIATVSSLKLASKMLVSLFPSLPKIKTLCWGEKMVPVREQEEPAGSASLDVLARWLDRQLEENGELRVILFSDGLFEDMFVLDTLATWIRRKGVHMSVVGVGADCDRTALAKLASNGIVRTVSDVEAVLAELTQAPLVPQWGSR